mgnify:CR=1 FL=1
MRIQGRPSAVAPQLCCGSRKRRTDDTGVPTGGALDNMRWTFAGLSAACRPPVGLLALTHHLSGLKKKSCWPAVRAVHQTADLLRLVCGGLTLGDADGQEALAMARHALATAMDRPYLNCTSEPDLEDPMDGMASSVDAVPPFFRDPARRVHRLAPPPMGTQLPSITQAWAHQSFVFANM